MALKIQLISNKEQVTQGCNIVAGRWFTAGMHEKLFIRISDSIYTVDSESLEFNGYANDRHTFTNVVYIEIANIQCKSLFSK